MHKKQYINVCNNEIIPKKNQNGKAGGLYAVINSV